MKRRVSDLCRSFLRWGRQTLKPITVAVYEHYFRGFIAHTRNRRLSALKPRHLSEWAKTWHQAQAIRRLFNWAVREDRSLKANIFEHVKQPPRSERRRIFTRIEQVRLLRRTRRDLRDFLVAMRETMARPGELRAATIDDLRPNDTKAELLRALPHGEACIVLADYKSRACRKHPNDPRVILLSPRVGRQIVRLIRRDFRGERRIWQTRLGRPWTRNALRCRFRRLRVALQVERDKRGETIVPYTFRHTAATLASAAGVRDRLLADVLGHTETSTTRRYQHLSTEHLRAALKKLWYRPRRPRRRRSNGDSGA